MAEAKEPEILCPSCRCPLALAGPAQSQIICARCEAVIELEARCNGVCLSCHAHSKTEDRSVCNDSSTRSAEDLQQNGSHSNSCHNDGRNKVAGAGIKALFKRLFHV